MIMFKCPAQVGIQIFLGLWGTVYGAWIPYGFNFGVDVVLIFRVDSQF